MRLHHLFLLVLAILLASSLSCGGGGKEPPSVPTYPSGKPADVDAEAGSRSATISWSPVAGAAGYYVYISQDGISFKKYKGELVYTTTFVVLNLDNGETYYFGVSAVGSGGWESSIAYPGGSPTAVPVVPFEAGPPPPPEVGNPPEPPRNLQGEALDGVVNLWWDYSVSGDFDYYLIYRRNNTMGGGFVLRENRYYSTTYHDTDLTNGFSYSYYVVAVDTEELTSEPSNTVDMKPVDSPPKPLEEFILVLNAGRVVLEWATPDEADIASYAIERVEPVEAPEDTEILVRFVIPKPFKTREDPHEYGDGLIKAWIDIETNTTTVSDMSVQVGELYTYRVAAIDTGGHEGPPVEAETKIPVY